MWFKSVAAFSAILALANADDVVKDLKRALLEARIDTGIDQNTSDYYIGYKAADYNTAWGKYFNDTPVELNAEFQAGLDASPINASKLISIQEAASALSQPGYLETENGYGLLDDGTMVLAIQSFVPQEFSGEMYDFWFSWHINDTTKYKLWFPECHQYAAVDNAQIAGDASKSSYRERYWNVTSFVDEYIGSTPYELSIAFFDPSLMGFETESCDTGIETIVTGFVSIANYNEQDPTSKAKAGFGAIDVVLAHQVRQRPDADGMEIRSRFWFGPTLVQAIRTGFDPLTLGHDLSVHCAKEMTHLGTFLPALFQEFRNDIPTGI